MGNGSGFYLSAMDWVTKAGVTFDTAVAVVGDRVVSNISTVKSDDFWRIGGLSGGSTSGVATIDLITDRTVDVLTAQFPRTEYPDVSQDNPAFAVTDTITWRLLDEFNVELYTSGVVASGCLPKYMTHFHRPPAAVAGVRKVEVTFDAISRAAEGFTDVGMVGVWGELFDPAYGPARPFPIGKRFNSESQRTPAGRKYTAPFDSLRRWVVNLDKLTDDESETLDDLLQYSGEARQIFVRRGDLSPGRDVMLALIDSFRDIQGLDHGRNDAQLTFEEFI